MKGTGTSHPWPAAAWHESQVWICLGLKPPILLEAVTCMCTYGQPLALFDYVSDFLSVGFFVRSSLANPKSNSEFHTFLLENLFRSYSLVQADVPATRTRNKEMSGTLKGQLIRKGVASLSIHRIKMQTQSCGSEWWPFLWSGSSHSIWTWIQACNHSGGFSIN